MCWKEPIYRQVLTFDPQNAVALHLLGVLMHQAGKTAQGIECIERALTIQRSPEFLSNLAELLRSAGQVERAIACCREAIKIAPTLVSSHQNLAVSLQQAAGHEEAEAVARKAVALDPADASGRRILASVLTSRGRYPEAQAEFDVALRLNPKDRLAWDQLGFCCESSGMLEHAVHCHTRAVQLEPNSIHSLFNLARLLVSRGRYSEALPWFDQLARLQPATIETQGLIARCLEGLNRFDEAIGMCRSILDRDPMNLAAHGVIGNARIQSGKFAEAEAGLREAMRLVPSSNFNQILAACVARDGRFLQGLDEINDALAKTPDYPVAEFSKALILMFLGRLEEAWPHFETRWKHPQMDAWRHRTDKPVWDGSPLDGRRILLYAEQGLGDTIHFARYATLVAERGGRVILEVQRGLNDLLKSVAGVERVIVRGEPVGEYDTLAPLLSLPGIFHTSLATIPATVPYVSVAPEKLKQWRQIIGDANGKLKVGIAWMGGDFQRENHLRSTTLSTFAPLAAVPGVRFYSIQKGPSARQAAQPPAGMELVDLDASIKDFSDTAAAIAHLDLVISVDTCVVHLAGALAKPVWNLLARNIGHMWMADREDSPWYPTMRLFRQPVLGDWESVMRRVADEVSGVNNRRCRDAEPNAFKSVERSHVPG